MDKIILENVHEYGEGIPVYLSTYNDRKVILAYNECGYNCVYIDLEELLESLKEIL